MPAIIRKINNNFPTSPELLLGMLLGHSDKIRYITAVVVWKDEGKEDEYQIVNTTMPLSVESFCCAMMQNNLYSDINNHD